MNIYSFGERTLPEYHTRAIVLSNSMAWPAKLNVFNKVSLVKHWHDIFNCSYEWLCLSNSCRCIGRKRRLILL